MYSYRDSDLAAIIGSFPEALVVVDGQGWILFGNEPAQNLGLRDEYPYALSAPAVVIDGAHFSPLYFPAPWGDTSATVVLLLPAGQARIIELEQMLKAAMEGLQRAEERCRRLETVTEASKAHAQRCEIRARQLPEELAADLQEKEAVIARQERRLGELAEELIKAKDQADRLKERIWEIRHESTSSDAELQSQVRQLERELSAALHAADRTGSHRQLREQLLALQEENARLRRDAQAG
ncbi:MAG: hypothetical protein HY319_13140 [Armatimonadetes bacterium]|nr:hypothetical protein [Armatimonadota bacterium]